MSMIKSNTYAVIGLFLLVLFPDAVFASSVNFGNSFYINGDVGFYENIFIYIHNFVTDPQVQTIVGVGFTITAFISGAKAYQTYDAKVFLTDVGVSLAILGLFFTPSASIHIVDTRADYGYVDINNTSGGGYAYVENVPLAIAFVPSQISTVVLLTQQLVDKSWAGTVANIAADQYSATGYQEMNRAILKAMQISSFVSSTDANSSKYEYNINEYIRQCIIGKALDYSANRSFVYNPTGYTYPEIFNPAKFPNTAFGSASTDFVKFDDTKITDTCQNLYTNYISSDANYVIALMKDKIDQINNGKDFTSSNASATFRKHIADSSGVIGSLQKAATMTVVSRFIQRQQSLESVGVSGYSQAAQLSIDSTLADLRTEGPSKFLWVTEALPMAIPIVLAIILGAFPLMIVVQTFIGLDAYKAIANYFMGFFAINFNFVSLAFLQNLMNYYTENKATEAMGMLAQTPFGIDHVTDFMIMQADTAGIAGLVGAASIFGLTPLIMYGETKGFQAALNNATAAFKGNIVQTSQDKLSRAENEAELDNINTHSAMTEQEASQWLASEGFLDFKDPNMSAIDTYNQIMRGSSSIGSGMASSDIIMNNGGNSSGSSMMGDYISGSYAMSTQQNMKTIGFGAAADINSVSRVSFQDGEVMGSTINSTDRLRNFDESSHSLDMSKYDTEAIGTGKAMQSLAQDTGMAKLGEGTLETFNNNDALHQDKLKSFADKMEDVPHSTLDKMIMDEKDLNTAEATIKSTIDNNNQELKILDDKANGLNGLTTQDNVRRGELLAENTALQNNLSAIQTEHENLNIDKAFAPTNQEIGNQIDDIANSTIRNNDGYSATSDMSSLVATSQLSAVQQIESGKGLMEKNDGFNPDGTINENSNFMSDVRTGTRAQSEQKLMQTAGFGESVDFEDIATVSQQDGRIQAKTISDTKDIREKTSDWDEDKIARGSAISSVSQQVQAAGVSNKIQDDKQLDSYMTANEFKGESGAKADISLGELMNGEHKVPVKLTPEQIKEQDLVKASDGNWYKQDDITTTGGKIEPKNSDVEKFADDKGNILDKNGEVEKENLTKDKMLDAVGTNMIAGELGKYAQASTLTSKFGSGLNDDFKDITKDGIKQASEDENVLSAKKEYDKTNDVGTQTAIASYDATIDALTKADISQGKDPSQNPIINDYKERLAKEQNKISSSSEALNTAVNNAVDENSKDLSYSDMVQNNSEAQLGQQIGSALGYEKTNSGFSKSIDSAELNTRSSLENSSAIIDKHGGTDLAVKTASLNAGQQAESSAIAMDEKLKLSNVEGGIKSEDAGKIAEALGKIAKASGTAQGAQERASAKAMDLREAITGKGSYAQSFIDEAIPGALQRGKEFEFYKDWEGGSEFAAASKVNNIKDYQVASSNFGMAVGESIFGSHGAAVAEATKTVALGGALNMLTSKIPGMGGEGVVEKTGKKLSDISPFSKDFRKEESDKSSANNQNSQSYDSFSNDTHDKLLNNKLADKNSTSKEIISEAKNNVKQNDEMSQNAIKTPNENINSQNNSNNQGIESDLENGTHDVNINGGIITMNDAKLSKEDQNMTMTPSQNSVLQQLDNQQTKVQEQYDNGDLTKKQFQARSEEIDNLKEGIKNGTVTKDELKDNGINTRSLVSGDNGVVDFVKTDTRDKNDIASMTAEELPTQNNMLGQIKEKRKELDNQLDNNEITQDDHQAKNNKLDSLENDVKNGKVIPEQLEAQGIDTSKYEISQNGFVDFDTSHAKVENGLEMATKGKLLDGVIQKSMELDDKYNKGEISDEEFSKQNAVHEKLVDGLRSGEAKAKDFENEGISTAGFIKDDKGNIDFEATSQNNVASAPSLVEARERRAQYQTGVENEQKANEQSIADKQRRSEIIEQATQEVTQEHVIEQLENGENKANSTFDKNIAEKRNELNDYKQNLNNQSANTDLNALQNKGEVIPPETDTNAYVQSKSKEALINKLYSEGEKATSPQKQVAIQGVLNDIAENKEIDGQRLAKLGLPEANAGRESYLEANTGLGTPLKLYTPDGLKEKEQALQLAQGEKYQFGQTMQKTKEAVLSGTSIDDLSKYYENNDAGSAGKVVQDVARNMPNAENKLKSKADYRAEELLAGAGLGVVAMGGLPDESRTSVAREAISGAGGLETSAAMQRVVETNIKGNESVAVSGKSITQQTQEQLGSGTKEVKEIVKTEENIPTTQTTESKKTESVANTNSGIVADTTSTTSTASATSNTNNTVSATTKAVETIAEAAMPQKTASDSNSVATSNMEIKPDIGNEVANKINEAIAKSVSNLKVTMPQDSMPASNSLIMSEPPTGMRYTIPPMQTINGEMGGNNFNSSVSLTTLGNDVHQNSTNNVNNQTFSSNTVYRENSLLGMSRNIEDQKSLAMDTAYTHEGILETLQMQSELQKDRWDSNEFS